MIHVFTFYFTEDILYNVQFIGVTGEVHGVMENGTVVVMYKSLRKKWNINPELLHKKVKLAYL